MTSAACLCKGEQKDNNNYWFGAPEGAQASNTAAANLSAFLGSNLPMDTSPTHSQAVPPGQLSIASLLLWMFSLGGRKWENFPPEQAIKIGKIPDYQPRPLWQVEAILARKKFHGLGIAKQSPA